MYLDFHQVTSIGPWTTEEEEQLQRIVEDMTVNRGGTLDDEVFWSAVAQKMGGRRNRQQCRNKWFVNAFSGLGKKLDLNCRTDVLSKQVKSNGQNPRWSNQDAYILVHKWDQPIAPKEWMTYLIIRLDSLRVRDDTEVDWKTLADKDWNLWSPHILQRRWQTMKKSVKGYEEMTHQGMTSTLDFRTSCNNSFSRNYGDPEG